MSRNIAFREGHFFYLVLTTVFISQKKKSIKLVFKFLRRLILLFMIFLKNCCLVALNFETVF